MIKLLSNLYLTHRYAKHFILLVLAAFILISYIIYVWINTESSNNAYLETDISNVSAEVSGVIKKILISDNTKVKQGDLIAEIDDAVYKTKLAEADSAVELGTYNIRIIEQQIIIENNTLEKSLVAMQLCKNNLDLIEVDYRRAAELNRDSFASQKLLDTAKLKLIQAKSEYNQAQLSLQISEQKLKSLNVQKAAENVKLQQLLQVQYLAQRDLANTKLSAPISGILSNSTGLRIGSFATPGMPLFSIVPQDNLYIKANFKETQITQFRPGMLIKIKFDALSQQIEGRIRNISPATGAKFSILPPDNATGNFTKVVQRVPVLIDFKIPDNVQGLLVPGMSVSVSVRIDR